MSILYEYFLKQNSAIINSVSEFEEWKFYQIKYSKIDDPIGYFFQTIDDNTPHIPYQANKAKFLYRSSSTHWGQFKLLISEIEFIALCYRVLGKKRVDESICVYAGSAAGTHIKHMSIMFPSIEFHLWDPSSFDAELVKYSILHPKRIKIYRTIFTQQSASKYRAKSTIFMSDVRRVSSANDPLATDRIKHEDHLLQKQWVEAMEPHATMLKFSPPWADSKLLVDEPEGIGSKYMYYDGINTTQAYAPISSVETRLIFFDPRMREYNLVQYESQLMYFNNHIRNILLEESQFWQFTIIDNDQSSTSYSFPELHDSLIPNYDNWRMAQVFFNVYLTLENITDEPSITIIPENPNPTAIIQHGKIKPPETFVKWFKEHLEQIQKSLGFTFTSLIIQRRGRKLEGFLKDN